jgi:hypothetical protein
MDEVSCDIPQRAIQTFNQAVAAASAGTLAEAERLCREAIAIHGDVFALWRAERHCRPSTWLGLAALRQQSGID